MSNHYVLDHDKMLAIFLQTKPPVFRLLPDFANFRAGFLHRVWQIDWKPGSVLPGEITCVFFLKLQRCDFFSCCFVVVILNDWKMNIRV